MKRSHLTGWSACLRVIWTRGHRPSGRWTGLLHGQIASTPM